MEETTKEQFALSKIAGSNIASIESIYSGSLLGKFLNNSFSLPFSLVSKLLRTKKVKVNGIVIKDHKFILSENDKVQIFHNLQDQKEKPKIKNNPTKDILKKIENSKIYEGENIFCLNKPYGISVQGGTKVTYNIIDSLETIFGSKLFIVHRIDKETRGILVLSKNLITTQKISELFQEGKVEKEYFAIVSPIPKKDEDTIKIPIEIEGKNKESITHYKIIERNIENNTAALLIKPETGRKHQIRIHLSKIGSPIVGDKKYHGNWKISKELQLYANKISIPEFGTFDANFKIKEILAKLS